MRLSRYFTLYFIPLFPTATLGEGVRCGSCAGEFSMGVLSLTAVQIEAALQPWTCAKCGNRNSSSERKCVACGDTPAAEPPPLPAAPATPPRIAQSRDDDEEY